MFFAQCFLPVASSRVEGNQPSANPVVAEPADWNTRRMDNQRRLVLVRDESELPSSDAPARKPPLIREAYGRVLREVRRDQDRTLDDVAAEVGMSKQYLSEIERGKKEPSSEILRSICQALGMPLEHLLFRSGNKLVALNSLTFGNSPEPISGPVLMAA